METLLKITILFGVLYLNPFLRIGTQFFPQYSPFLRGGKGKQIGIFLGKIEYLLGPPRDHILSPALLIVGILKMAVEKGLTPPAVTTLSIIAFYCLVSMASCQQRQKTRLHCAKLAYSLDPPPHPGDFFELYYLGLSPWPITFVDCRGVLQYAPIRQLSYGEVDFRSSEKPRQSFFNIVKSALSTSTLATMAILAFKKMGADYGRDAFDALARLWGARVAQNFKLCLKTTGADTLAPIEGKTLLVFNHKSFLDFALNFFALGGILKSDGRHLRPRFITAKDHFIDNPFVYSWINLGKVIENAGMIFINRKKGKGWEAMEEAAKKLISSEVEIAVYPQGTRAYPMYTPTNESLDAGYYSTFRPKRWQDPLGHLKPGTAQLILNTLIELHKRGEEKLNVVITGIMGSGLAAPKGRWTARTQTEITYHVGPLWTLSSKLAEGVCIPQDLEAKTPEEALYQQRLQEIQQELNFRLIESMDWHTILMEKLTANSSISCLEKLHLASQHKQMLPFILLDRIFSLQAKEQKKYLNDFVLLNKEDINSPKWQTLLQDVSERLITK